MNPNILLCFGTCLLMTAGMCATDNPSWEDRPTGSRENVADQWWCNTWRLGDHVETVSTYHFEGNMKIDTESADKIRWWEFWRKYLDKELSAVIKGTSKAYTDVLMGVGRNGEKLPKDAPVQLVRWYESPMSFRGLAVVGLKDGQKCERVIREAENQFIESLDDPVYAGIKKTAEAGCVMIVASGLTAASAALSCPIPPTISKMISAYIVHEGAKFGAKKLAEQRQRNLEKLAGGTLSDDGIEAKSKGWFFKRFKSDDVSKLSNLATAYNGLFNYSTFYICGKEKEQIYAKKIIEGSPECNTLQNNAKNPLALPAMMRQFGLTADDNKARNILARETIDINEKLFGLRKRVVGDEWVTDARILNGFLHQDLTGSFSGFIAMKYLGDEEISLMKFGADIASRAYKVRHITMERSSKGRYTSFSYEEPGGFELRYDSRNETNGKDTTVDMYVDIQTGYIVKVLAKFSRTEIKALPKLRLSDGFRYASGDVSFLIDSESCPMRGLDLLEQK